MIARGSVRRTMLPKDSSATEPVKRVIGFRLALQVVLGLLGLFASEYSFKCPSSRCVRKRNPQVNAALPPETDLLIAGRAKALGITKSKFVALVLERWQKNGARAVSEADEALLAHSAAKKKTAKA